MAHDETMLAPAPRRPREWRRALRALRGLLANPDDTILAFEIFDAVDRGVEERAFQRFRRDPVGRRLLAERPSLAAALGDRAALAALPAGSFGRAYAAYLDANRFDALGLLALKTELEARLQARGETRPALDEARAWFRDRSILTHDLWHVLTGYGTDDLGEAALLPFTLAQSGGSANAILVAGVAVRGVALVGASFAPYLVEAWRRGRRAAWLAALPYEELLSEPLAAVRRHARIAPPEEAHRGGIRVGRWRPHDAAAVGSVASPLA
jgi:ubiquinone biosynthesis protein COQ4